mmetsp:Transcript_64072/g.202442  ORF Transcript_64072/g.202442 Transcript_64072/m.202442 type:complete len:405 (-) Transcript_64072:27-1241(-)
MDAGRGGRWRQRPGPAAATVHNSGFRDEGSPAPPHAASAAPAATAVGAEAVPAAAAARGEPAGQSSGGGAGGGGGGGGGADEAGGTAREEERSVLEAIYGSEFEATSDCEWRIDLPGPAAVPPASLYLLLPAGYPGGEAPPVPLVQSECNCKALQEVAAEVVQELLAEWQPAVEGCVYQWAERIREALRPVLEEAAGAAAAEAAQREELEAAAAQEARERAAAAAAGRAFEYLPANPQYGQRRRNFDESSFDPANAVEVKQGDPFTDRKSTFQAYAAKVTSQGQVQWVLRTLLADRRIAVATHNIFAYRFKDKARDALIADNDDDGEDTAGTKLAELLNLAGCENVFVMVSRWYGGIQLGPDRFKHICRAASTLLDSEGWSRRGRGSGAVSAAKPRGGTGSGKR